MQTKSLLTYTDISPESLNRLIDGCQLFNNNKENLNTALAGKIIGILFTTTSTRTRTSFWSAAIKLGANVINFGPDDLQVKTGETLSDTGLILGKYVDALVVRTNKSLNEMKDLSVGVPVINAMSACEHPSQILGDYIAMQEHFGRNDYFEIAYFGEGNNTASAMAYFFARLPNMKVDFYMPKAYSLSNETIATAKKFAENSGSVINVFNEIPEYPDKADIIYTTRWQTMGVSHADTNWKDSFNAFRVDESLFNKFSKDKQSIFMHDLPAVRGDEVTAGVLDGPQSIALRQAYHKLTGAAGALLWSLSD